MGFSALQSVESGERPYTKPVSALHKAAAFQNIKNTQ